jgi:hypothetical protein
MISNPKIFFDQGVGKLTNGKVTISVIFDIFMTNQEPVIYCYPDKSYLNDFLLENRLSLTGKTVSGNVVRADNLLHIDFDTFIELLTNDKIYIGHYFDYKNTANKIEFHITNLFELNHNFSFEGFNINISSSIEPILQRISIYWRLPQVASIITLEKEGETIDEYLNFINFLIIPISIATGRHISFGIQHIYNENRNYKALHNNFSSCNFIKQIIPDTSLNAFISSGMEKVKNLEHSKYLDLKTINEYLNETDHGYLDDRILRLVQCWEILANSWVKSKPKLTVEIQELKSEIKENLKGWHEKYPDLDKDRLLDDRLHKALEWEKSVSLLEGILKDFNLDNDILKIDFPRLIKLRNSVAHSGRFEEEDTLHDLLKGQFGLRLIILRIFGYEGSVNDYISGEIKPINIFMIINKTCI